MALSIDDEGNFYEDEYSDLQGTTGRMAEVETSSEGVEASNAAAEDYWEQWLSSGAGDYVNLSETMASEIGYTSASGPVNATKVAAASEENGQSDPKESIIGTISDKFTGVGDWIKKNPKSADVILGVIAAAAKGSSERDVAERNARSRIEEQNNADRIKQEEVQRMSNSVTGIKRPTRGLIPQYLTRKDGSRVFQPGGKLTGA